jgi:hypothetical protein
MKSPQGREAKKPKGKTQAQNFQEVARKIFQVPKSGIDPNSCNPDINR